MVFPQDTAPPDPQTVQVRTIGVEEEFMLVSPGGRPHPVAPAVLQHAAALDPEPSAGDLSPPPGGALEKEFKQEQIETSTHPCTDLGVLTDQIREGRSRANASAQHAGARIAAVATMPGVVHSTVIRDRRSRLIGADFGHIAREQLTCGCHVHVGVAGDDEGVVVLDHLRAWTPVLLALSANSPFWQGADSGYASFRTQVWNRWPTAGATPPFGDGATYRRVVADLVRSGTIVDDRMVYFDARLSPRYPTVEVRVADVCLDVEDVVVQAALVRALAETAIEGAGAGGGTPAGDASEPGEMRTEQLRVASWRAARSGLSGDLLSPTTGLPRPAASVLAELLDHVGPALARFGDLDRVRARFEAALREGTGADQQRAWHREFGDLDAVVARAADRTIE